MSQRKRLSTIILLLAIFLPILAACGGGGDTGSTGTTDEATGDTTGEATDAEGAEVPPESGDAAPAVDIEGATAGSAGDITQIPVEEGATIRFVSPANPTEQQLYLEGAARFEQLFPGVTVEYEPINDQYLTRMTAEFTAGTAPDVLLVDGEVMGNIGYNGLLLSLDEAMGQAGVEASEYVDPLIELYQQDGQTYAIPKDFNPLVVFINNEMAEAAGVDPTSIQTWDDLKTAADSMTEGEGPGKTFGMCLNPDILRYGAFMFQNGNPIIDGTQAVFNEPEGVAAMDYWLSYKTDGVGELFSNMGRGWCGEAFGGRNAAMAIEGGWIVPFLDDPANGATDLPYTAIPLPTPENGEPATWLFTNGIGVNANTEFPNASAALALFLTSDANQKALIPSGLAQPSLKALAEDPYYSENEVAKVLVEQGEFGRLADTTLGGPVIKGDIINTINQDALEPIFLGAQTPQEALDAAAETVNGLLAE
ncbi:MAG: sugar ABC transporter substrate-binding protein [Chloroflexota bacterium]